MLQIPWETGFDADLFLVHLFERIGYAPFECYQGYGYRFRPGSICHSANSHETIRNEYNDILRQLHDSDDRLCLRSSTCQILTPLLEHRIRNLLRYENDEKHGRLAYEAQVIGDVLMYPLTPPPHYQSTALFPATSPSATGTAG